MTSEPFMGDCDCCQFEGVLVKTYEPVFGKSDKRDLCDLCASTMASSSIDYPNQWDGKQAQVIQAVCYVGNAILAALSRNAQSTAPK